ncbi:GFA family protein [Novosphingobium sp. BL-8A]|uniref:GFA family protein n=1 Tax=Novosphingobium sp. BL-8A TaxID=3127639 RepID=UPI0037571C69
MTVVTSGSCQCGAVRFDIRGQFESFYLCHCSRCRKDTGSAHASNLFSSTATVVWHSGNEKITQYQVPATRHARSFCSVCGSALPSVQMDGALLVVPAGCLDDEIAVSPDAHIYVSSRATWDDRMVDIPGFAGLPM